MTLIDFHIAYGGFCAVSIVNSWGNDTVCVPSTSLQNTASLWSASYLKYLLWTLHQSEKLQKNVWFCTSSFSTQISIIMYQDIHNTFLNIFPWNTLLLFYFPTNYLPLSTSSPLPCLFCPKIHIWPKKQNGWIKNWILMITFDLQ